MSFQKIVESKQVSNLGGKKKHKNSHKGLNSDLILYPYNSELILNKSNTLKKIEFYPKELKKIKTYQTNSALLSKSNELPNQIIKQSNSPTIFLQEKASESLNFQSTKSVNSLVKIPNLSINPNDSSSIFNINETNKDETRAFRKEIIEIEQKEITINFNFTKDDWMFWLIIGGVLLFIGVKVFFKKILSETFQSIYNNNTSNRMFRERNQVFLISSTILKTIFSVNIGIFTYLTLQEFLIIPDKYSSFQQTTFFIFLWASIYTVKYILFAIIGFLSNTNSHLKLYLHNTALLNKVYGILLFPIIFSIPYLNSDIISTKVLVYVGWSIFILFYIIRISKGLLICIRQKIYLFYTILYLCALEIIPLIIIYKLILLIGMSSIR